MVARDDHAHAVIRDVRNDLAAFGRVTTRTDRGIDAFLNADRTADLGLPSPEYQPETTMPNDRDNAWHLDKRVPIALILAIFMQAAVTIWWAAGLSGDVRDMQRRVIVLEASDKDQTEIIRQVRELLARIDERMTIIIRQLPAR